MQTLQSKQSPRPIQHGLSVGGHEDGAAEPEVVLQAVTDTGDLSGAGLVSQMQTQLDALRHAGRPERVSLRDEPAARVHDVQAAVRVVAAVDEAAGLSCAGDITRRLSQARAQAHLPRTDQSPRTSPAHWPRSSRATRSHRNPSLADCIDRRPIVPPSLTCRIQPVPTNATINLADCPVNECQPITE